MVGHFIYAPIIFLLCSLTLYGQISLIPPYKISRYLHFNLSENFVFDSNVFKVDNSGNNEDSWLVAHSFQMSHADTRPWYSYEFSYHFSYRNYIGFQEYDDSGHNVNFAFTIPRKDSSFSFFENFTVSSDPLTLEFGAFVRSYTNKVGMGTQYKLTKYIGLSANLSHDLYRYPNNHDLDSDSVHFGTHLAYYFSRQISLSSGVNYEIQWRNLGGKRSNYSIPLNINLNLRERQNQNVELSEWFREFRFSFGYSFSEDTFENPINFEISMGGDLSQLTIWNFNASRKMEFAILSGEFTFTTKAELILNHRFTPDLAIGIQASYERIDYEILPSLNGITIGLNGQYAITKWIRIQFGYTYTNRFTEKSGANYDSHRISLGTGVYF